MINLYLIRHGETELNKSGLYYGWTDCSLSNKGLEQASEVRKELQAVVPDVIISSPLKRTVQTAEIVCENDIKKIIYDDRIKEINFGLWENKYIDYIKQNYKETWNNWCSDWKNTKPPEGECFNQMYNRTVDFVEEIINNYKDNTVFIVSHQGCLRIILSYLLNLKQDGFWHFTFEQGTYSHIEIDEYNYSIIRSLNRR